MLGLVSLSQCASDLESVASRRVEPDIPMALRDFVRHSQKVVDELSVAFLGTAPA